MKRSRATARPFLQADQICSYINLIPDESQPVFILIPGLGSEAELWIPVAHELARQGRSVAILEPPPYGYRHPANCRVTLADMAAAVDIARLVGDRPRIYVGHSAGVMGALELAKVDPKAIGLVSVNGLLDDIAKLTSRPGRYIWRHPVKALRLASLLVYLRTPLPEFILRRLEKPDHILGLLFWPLVARPRQLSPVNLRRLVRHNHCAGGVASLRINRRYDWLGQAAHLTMPFLALEGRHDPLTNPPSKSQFFAAVTSDRHYELLNCGHCSPIEMTDAVARHILNWAQALKPIPRP